MSGELLVEVRRSRSGEKVRQRRRTSAYAAAEQAPALVGRSAPTRHRGLSPWANPFMVALSGLVACCRAAIGYQRHMSTLDSAARAASYAGGQMLRAATGIIAARPANKPLHPRGSVVQGTLHRFGAEGKTGTGWLDQTGDDHVLVRQSRAIGMPAHVPDIHGLAIRVPTEGGRYGDLLLASTGLGRLTRFTLTAARSPFRRPLTTLLPYRTPVGAVLLSAVFHNESRVELAWAIRSGVWNPFAELLLAKDPVNGADMPVSFDPVRNVLPGLEPYDWVQRLREPSYATARRSRRS